jgi:ribosomal 30S subunit maturation factor RimM
MVMEMNALATKHGVDGSWRIKSGTGELAGLNGEGTWWFTNDPGGTYSGKVHW